MEATRTATGHVVIDGMATEADWFAAPRAGGFTQNYPHQNVPAGQLTFARAMFDGTALYVHVEARDRTPDRIRGLLTQRDTDSPSDWLEVWLDPQADGRTGYRFAVNAHGVQLDSRLSQGGEVQDLNWHAAWQSGVQIDEHGWSAEFRIPLSELRYASNVTTWRIQVVRRVARTNESSTLAPSPKAAARPLLHMAELRGLSHLPEAGGFAFRPFGLLRVEAQGPHRDIEPRLGGDVRWNPSSATTVHATAFPDFGQVEQDPSQLNLSAFELMLAERRQFFLDGLENLTLPLSYANSLNEQLYYSRRIGARPTRDLGLDEKDIIEYPTESGIIGAAKLLGRTNAGLNYGMLNAVTQSESTTHVDADGQSATSPVASPTSYNLVRVRQEVQGGRGQVSTTAAYVHRFLHPELATEQVESALSGGSDFDLRFGDVGLKGQVVGSALRGSPEAIDRIQRSATNNLHRPDAYHLSYDPERTQLLGTGVALAGGLFDGSPFRAFWGGQVRSPGFNTNDMGFLRSADQQKWETSLQYRFDEPTPWYQFGYVQGGAWFEKTWGPEVTSLGSWADTSWHLANNWWTWLGGNHRFEAWDTRLLRGGPSMLVPGGNGGWAGFSTDNRKPWDLSVGLNGDLGHDDSLVLGKVAVTASFRPTSSLTLSFAPSLEGKLDDLQYVETEAGDSGDVYYLGRLHQRTYTLTLRMSWALALGLTVQLYASPFLSFGRYERIYSVTDPSNNEYSQRREQANYDGARSFHASQVRSNVVVRWDFSPGSTAYLAWTHDQSASREDRDDVRLGRDAADLLAARSWDVVMLKAEYYFSTH